MRRDVFGKPDPLEYKDKKENCQNKTFRR